MGEERPFDGSTVGVKTPETAIHQTGSPEITWHAGKWNLKINEKRKERWVGSTEPREGGEWKRL